MLGYACGSGNVGSARGMAALAISMLTAREETGGEQDEEGGGGHPPSEANERGGEDAGARGRRQAGHVPERYEGTPGGSQIILHRSVSICIYVHTHYMYMR